MTDNSLRNAIEQALFTAIQDQPRGVGGQVVSFYGFEDMPPRLRKTIRDEADAVLAVLTELPESVIDRVRELHKGQVDDFGDRFCVTCWSSDWPCLTLQAIGESDD